MVEGANDHPVRMEEKGIGPDAVVFGALHVRVVEEAAAVHVRV